MPTTITIYLHEMFNFSLALRSIKSEEPVYLCFTHTIELPQLDTNKIPEYIFQAGQHGVTPYKPFQNFAKEYMMSKLPSISINNIIGIATDDDVLYFRVDPTGFTRLETINIAGCREEWEQYMNSGIMVHNS